MYQLYVLMISNNLKLYSITVNSNRTLIDSLWKIKVAKWPNRVSLKKENIKKSLKWQKAFKWRIHCVPILAESVQCIQYFPVAGLLECILPSWGRYSWVVEQYSLSRSKIDIYHIKDKDVFTLTLLMHIHRSALGL